jgi:hypothetical protein
LAQAPPRMTTTRSYSPAMTQQSFPGLTGFNAPAVRQPVGSPYGSPVATTRVPTPQTYYPQPARGFGGFPGISPVPPSPVAAPFSFPEIFQPYLGEAPTFGKTFPSFFPSSISIKTPPPPCIKTFLADLKDPDPKLKDSVPLESSGPSNSKPYERGKLQSCLIS